MYAINQQKMPFYDFDIEMEMSTDFEFKKGKDGRYEWGFDLTDFNNDEDEYDEETGATKFKELLDIFDMKQSDDDDLGFVWKNNQLSMTTGNNPLTGEGNSHSHERGYLSYVGISCDSTTLLQDFIDEFRKRATYIKEEANRRYYI